ncbi:thiol:disulfide oxidoreductase [Duganella sp. BJB488]|uniref:glutathione S-transferase N-terminal domain-containing protein n=1 Tax=unclassified Duganella TaxID=2636909 RepID=UPI000E34D610|nr:MULTISPECIES: glutathione S-transferase N-terminal domain-containing protein [unclassified Duganella]RFP20343.1 thiol:disulfide oxidoreductase [Duganella sp. BJB489]RFP21213.1 thiol:disulfide oxidoreductase [Duganella sp. BJB488]RFP33354.1 thiol:disulfide oxidoreductase [Duganella sp. BJB480]
MIDLYYAATPNGLKMTMYLEEAGIDYRLIRVNIGKGEQFAPEYLRISPNNKIPALVDHAPADGGPPLSMFESAAMLQYLADKSGFGLPRDPRARLVALQWLTWQVAGLGPMAGQIGHFNIYAPETVPYAIDRYTRETRRLYGVLDKQLQGREFIAGEFSIADIACYPWIVPHEGHGQTLSDFPDLQRWFEAIRARPATVKAYVGVENVYARKDRAMSDEERAILFGQGRAV